MLKNKRLIYIDFNEDPKQNTKELYETTLTDGQIKDLKERYNNDYDDDLYDDAFENYISNMELTHVIWKVKEIEIF